MMNDSTNERIESARDRRTGNPRSHHTQVPRRREDRSRQQVAIPDGERLVACKDPRCPSCGGVITFFEGCGRRKVPCCDPCGVCFPKFFLENVKSDGNQRAALDAGIQNKSGQPSGLPSTACSESSSVGDGVEAGFFDLMQAVNGFSARYPGHKVKISVSVDSQPQ